jgi:hypothetical protein
MRCGLTFVVQDYPDRAPDPMAVEQRGDVVSSGENRPSASLASNLLYCNFPREASKIKVAWHDRNCKYWLSMLEANA